MQRLIPILGLLVILGIAYLMSSDRNRISRRVVLWGLALQLIFAVLVLGIPAVGIPALLDDAFALANAGFKGLIDFTDAGSAFIFGPLLDTEKMQGYVFAVKVLPTIVFFSSLMAIGYYLQVMQKIVKGMAWLMQKTMGTSGAETLSMAANVFVGQTEAPLLVRPYIETMTKSELMTMMTGGMATVAGGVMAAYVAQMHLLIPDIAGHLLTASVLSAPAALVLAKIIIPETGTPLTQGTIKLHDDGPKDANVIEAAARGAGDGLKLALNVGAMLLAFIALIAMLNAILQYVGVWIDFPNWGAALVPHALLVEGQAHLSMQVILGWLFAPLAYLMGVAPQDCTLVGALLGEKIVVNEFVAYLHMAQIGEQLSHRSLIIASYALCGFANFSSIAIQIGGIGGIAPSRRSDLAKIGLRAMIAGTLAACMTACIAGMLI